MGGCLKTILVIVVVVIVGDLFFDFLDGLQRVLESIPWWLWILGIIGGLFIIGNKES